MTATYLREGRGRSLRALEAEDNDRLPLTRAIPVVAKRAGVTQKVARAALEATHDGEWHHVGKYAGRCDYYDVEAACRYASPEYAAQCEADEHAEMIEQERQRLIRQRDCTRPVKRHSSHLAWQRRLSAINSTWIPIGDMVAFREAQQRHAARLAERVELDALLAAHFTPAKDDFGRTIHVLRHVRVLIHSHHGEQVNIYVGTPVAKLTWSVADAIVELKRKITSIAAKECQCHHPNEDSSVPKLSSSTTSAKMPN